VAAVDDGSLGVLAGVLLLCCIPSPVSELAIGSVHCDSEEHQSGDECSEMPQRELLHEQVGQVAGLEEDEQHAEVEEREQQSNCQIQRHWLQRGERGEELRRERRISVLCECVSRGLTISGCGNASSSMIDSRKGTECCRSGRWTAGRGAEQTRRRQRLPLCVSAVSAVLSDG
jgi:hypothetical protein